MNLSQIQIGKIIIDENLKFQKTKVISNELNIINTSSLYIKGRKLIIDSSNMLKLETTQSLTPSFCGTLCVSKTIVCNDYILTCKDDNLEIETLLFYNQSFHKYKDSLYNKENDITYLCSNINNYTINDYETILIDYRINFERTSIEILNIISKINVPKGVQIYNEYYGIDLDIPVFELNQTFDIMNWLYTHSISNVFSYHTIALDINGIIKEVAVPCSKPHYNQNSLNILTNLDYKTEDYIIIKPEVIINELPSFDFNHYKINSNVQGGDSFDLFIVKQCIYKWESIITSKISNSDYDLNIYITFDNMDDNILASAGPTQYIYYNNKLLPTHGIVNINTKYWSKLRQQIKKNHLTGAYFTLLHEIGHILGIGILWIDHNLLQYGPWYNTSYWWTSNFNDALYVGENAYREYKNYIIEKTPNIDITTILGIPVENDGGIGTKGGHPEESQRYFDGHYHIGLDSELMTGWAEGGDIPEPLSRISIGFLEDLGYNVDYDLSDNFNI